MMRHIFAGSGIEGVARGALYGAGLGAFVFAPWLATNYAFAERPLPHFAIDAGHAIGASAVIGLILQLF